MHSENLKLPVRELQLPLLLENFVISRRCFTWAHWNAVRKKECCDLQTAAGAFIHSGLTWSFFFFLFIYIYIFIYIYSVLNMNQPVKHTHMLAEISVWYSLDVWWQKKQNCDLKPFAVHGHAMPYTLPRYHQMAISTATFCSLSWWFDIPRSRHQVHFMQPTGLRG